MRTFSISTDIDAPPDRVWEVMSDVERWHEWTASVTSIKRLDAGDFAVGSRAMIRQPKFPPARWTVVAIEPGRAFTWVSRAPGIRVTARHRVERSGTRSRATLSLEYGGVFGGLMGLLTRDITKRYLELEARGLKARSEGRS